ncbi:MAG: T9SS type A sorting domain-containing protein [Bacteroidetes bacterium]|nr:T9SS type A sorting domain-containing protein [Bacteroidota bacterium]
MNQRNYLKWTISGMITLCCTLYSVHTISYTNNPPLSRTGAPGEANCTACHSGTAITSGTEYNNLKITTNMKNGEYIPDSTYKVTVDYTESGKSKFGFMATTLRNADDEQAGSYTVLNSTTTAKGTAKVNSKDREYLYHKGAGTSGSGGNSWTFEWTAPSKNEGDITFYVALNSTNNNSGNSGDKIVLKSFGFEPSSLLPTAKIDATNTTVCVGDTLHLLGYNSKNATAYQWTANGATTSNKKDSLLWAVYATPGTYTVKLQTSNSIAKSDEAKNTITVLASPANTVDISPNDSVCSGETITLEAKDGVKWNWSNAQTGQKNAITQQGAYTVEIEGSNGCKSLSDTIKLTFIDPPAMHISTTSPDTICQTDSLELSLSTGFVKYEIFDKSLPINALTNSSAKLAFLPGLYQLTAIGTDAFGCISNTSNMLSIEVGAQSQGPMLTCDSVGIEALKLSWNDLPNSQGFEISLDSGNKWLPANGLNGASHLVDGLGYGTEVAMWVRAVMPPPCNYSSVSQLTCKTKNCFNVAFQLDGNQSCINDSLGILQVRHLSLQKYAIAFDTQDYGLDTIYAFSPADLGVGQFSLPISIIDSTALTCPAFDTTITIVVSPVPSPRMLTTWTKVNGQNKLCIDADQVTLSGSRGENGTAYARWTFSGSGVQQVNDTQFVFNPMSSGVGLHYLVYRATNKQGCEAHSTDSVYVDRRKSASFTYTANGLSLSFTGLVTGAQDWEWDFGDGNKSKKTNPVHNYAGNGTYTVQLTTLDPNNICPEAQSSQDIAVVSANVGHLALEPLEMYPMPFHDLLQFNLPTNEKHAIRIFTASGQMLGEWNGQSGQVTLRLDHLRAGMYLLQVQNNSASKSRIVIKE